MRLPIADRFFDDSKAIITDLAKAAGLSPEEVVAKDNIEAATSLLDQQETEETGPA